MLTTMFVLSMLAVDPHNVRIAVCQTLVIDGDRDGNFRRIEYALEAAKAGGAAIATFPESSILGWENPDAHRLAHSIPGPDSERIASLAKKHGLMIAIGIDEKDGDHLYGAAILVDRKGQLLWKHRKINVLPELMSPPYSTGSPDGIGVVQTEFGRIGVMICADTFTDAHFEKLRSLKPDLMLVPYGWAAPVDQWPEHAKQLERLISRRAKLLGCPMVGTDLVGVMSQGPWKGRTYGGASFVADATGRIIATLRDRDVDVKIVDVKVGRVDP